MEKLMAFLNSIQPGLVDASKLDKLLAGAWPQLKGIDDEGMKDYKLLDRMKNVDWSPPVLTFSIERHGAAVLGSTRAELQIWQVDVKQRTATPSNVGYRQLYPRQPPLDAKKLANEIMQLILDSKQDKRLKWYPDRSVKVLVGKILPEASAVKQTLAGRRQRFRSVLEELLKTNGWVSTGIYKYVSQSVDPGRP